MRATLLFALASILTPAAFADLILSPTQITGAGLGNLTTILTVQSQGNDTFESGCISSDGINTSCAGALADPPVGEVKTGASQTGLREIPTGTAASDLVFIFNAAEPGQAGNDILLQTLAIQFYNATGGLLHVATYTDAPVLLSTVQGIGGAGYQLILDSTQSAVVQGFLDAGTVQMGATLAAGCTGNGCAGAATGGPDVVQFAIVPGDNGGGSEIPEPMTFALMGGGLLALGVMRRFR